MVKRFAAFLSLLFVVFVSCKTKKPQPADTGTSGTIYISVDEAFKPIIEEQVKVFESAYPKAKIIAEYKPEAECWDDLLNDSTRMVIVTRKLTAAEARYYSDSLGLYPKSELLARDAVALVVNRSAADSVFTKEDVQELLLGTSKLPYKPVFDGVKATSSVRYAIDSILKGKMFNTSVITAAKNSSDVVDYISRNPGYVGFVGVSWIGNPEDVNQLEMLKKVRIAWLPCDSCDEAGTFTKPWQEEILTKRYPYSREIYYVLKENHAGLGKAFVNFMNSDRGQLIFRRGYLVPGRRIYIMRETQLKLVKPVTQ
ncbi:phosphate transport system substrate-binding protein [Lacibacter cauensis]|uniref:Phosphate transport system substrate-binding protein n=1 Tax=Lacibacter cauensis TaxID=510947 RepID=A0A562SJA5_9BACT|nr:substrate-binding domain-containing protein [Lacibacter cauensis]TWI81173.1 phosphate transport system substrate-binding protein [Lacibacter cauensis]